jgi:NAD(P)-dependent dehydrogenase (short-subunit alcohol dehydrogenase family)
MMRYRFAGWMVATRALLFLAPMRMHANLIDPYTRWDAASFTSASASSEPRVALITGSTGGLGRAVAEALGAEGWRIIVHGRNAEAGAAVVETIERDGGQAWFIQADLADLEATRAMAHTILERESRLDLLVANAGIWLDPEDGRQETPEGHELHFQVNYLSHFLLTHLLLPRLQETGQVTGDVRILQIASIAQSPIDFDDVMLTRNGAHTRGYGQSKLAQIFLARDLGEALLGSPVIAVSLHPATLMDTGMVLDRGILPRTSVGEGLEAVRHLIRVRNPQPGGYYRGLTLEAPHPQADDAEARARLRALSERLVGLAGTESLAPPDA